MRSWWRVFAGAIAMMVIFWSILMAMVYIESLPKNLCGTDRNGIVSQGKCR